MSLSPSETEPEASATSLEWSFDSELAFDGLSSPARVAVNSAGVLVVTDARRGSVWRIGPDQVPELVARAGIPLGCALTDDGRLYVGDDRSGRVDVYDRTGHHEGVLGSGDGEFGKPNDMVVDESTGNVFVVDSTSARIRVYDGSGYSLYEFGTSGGATGQMAFPAGIAIDAARGKVYVTDTIRGVILVYAVDGTWLAEYAHYGGAEPGALTRPQGLTVDRQGRIFVTDIYQGWVQVFDPDGAHIGFVGEYGTGAGQLSLPTDAVFLSNDVLLVTSYGGSKLVKYNVTTTGGELVEPTEVLVELTPSVLSVASEGQWLTAEISSPDLDVTTIDIASLALQGVASVPTSQSAGLGTALDGDERVARVRFSRQDVLGALGGAGVFELDLTGLTLEAAPIHGSVSLELVGAAGEAKPGERHAMR